MQPGYHRIPIIKLWQLLLLPLQGEMTDEVAAQLTTDVLDRIHKEGCSGLVIDITGLWVFDSHLCSVLSQLSAAASLMGARTFISGMKPEIALTLETMGVALKGVKTTLNLEGALHLLGVLSPEESKRLSKQAKAAGLTASSSDAAREDSFATLARVTGAMMNGGDNG
jgi:rsbT antagonist protein RsbS